MGGIFSSPSVPAPAKSAEEVIAERDAAAADESRRQKVAAVQATGRRKLNSPLTGAAGIDDATNTIPRKLF
mgnify:CR=1 FL=1